MDWRKIVITCAAALALVAGGTAAGAAIAQGPVSNGQVQGCYDSGGNLRVLVPGETSCPKGWTSLNWSQQGPQGPRGPAGPQGPPGPSGSLSSLDDLTGIPCANGHGVTYVSYGTIPGPGNPNWPNGGSVTCLGGIPAFPLTWAGSPFGCGDSPNTGGSSEQAQVQVSVPYSSTAGPKGFGQWWTVTGDSASDSNSPPNCVYQGMTVTLEEIQNGSFVPSTHLSMDVYAGSSYTGQAPVATGVTSFNSPTGGTFLINVYTTNAPPPGFSDFVGASLLLVN